MSMHDPPAHATMHDIWALHAFTCMFTTGPMNLICEKMSENASSFSLLQNSIVTKVPVQHLSSQGIYTRPTLGAAVGADRLGRALS